MEFRRGNRDERRRRVLIEEPGDAAAIEDNARVDEPGAESTEPARRYSSSALSMGQPRVVDLIPTRWWTNLALCCLLLGTAIGLEMLYRHVALGRTPLDIRSLPAIDLAQHGNIATWFSSALLACCGLYGLLSYQIRRFRVDDYRGRYRMWCWMVPLFWFASIDQVAGLQETARTALLQLAGIPDYAEAMLVWVGCVTLVGAAIGIRLLMEMRGCRLSSLLLLAAMGALATVAGMHVDWWLTMEGVQRTMTVTSLTMGAHLALFLAIVLYTRHLYHEARGPVTGQPRRTRKKVTKPRPSRAGSTDEAANTSAASKRGANSPAKATRSSAKVRRQADKVLRTDPPHDGPAVAASEPAAKRSGPLASRGERKRSDAAVEEANASDRSAGKEKRRVAAQVATPVESTSSSLCEPDDDQLEGDGARKLSKAERKKLRKQRRQQRTS